MDDLEWYEHEILEYCSIRSLFRMRYCELEGGKVVLEEKWYKVSEETSIVNGKWPFERVNDTEAECRPRKKQRNSSRKRGKNREKRATTQKRKKKRSKTNIPLVKCQDAQTLESQLRSWQSSYRNGKAARRGYMILSRPVGTEEWFDFSSCLEAADFMRVDSNAISTARIYNTHLKHPSLGNRWQFRNPSSDEEQWHLYASKLRQPCKELEQEKSVLSTGTTAISGFTKDMILQCTSKIPQNPVVYQRVHQVKGRTVAQALQSSKEKGKNGQMKSYSLADLKYDIKRGHIQDPRVEAAHDEAWVQCDICDKWRKLGATDCSQYQGSIYCFLINLCLILIVLTKQ
jgi:hypothetical protein